MGHQYNLADVLQVLMRDLVTGKSGTAIDSDAEQLKSLGYVSHFDRTMSKWENFSLGFTYLSPVVGVYTIFASALARVAMFGFVCELVGAIAVGGYLLLFARHQPLDVLVNTSFVQTDGHYGPAFLASSLAAMFCYYGFEACGDVAEETPDASRMIPKAMRMTIYIGGAAASWVCLAFISCLLSLQAAARRLIFAYARDQMIFGSKYLSRLSLRL